MTNPFQMFHNACEQAAKDAESSQDWLDHISHEPIAAAELGATLFDYSTDMETDGRDLFQAIARRDANAAYAILRILAENAALHYMDEYK